MKKILLLLLVFGVFFCTGALLMANSEVQNSEEEYDEDEFGPSAPVIWVKPVKSVVFEHKVHTMGAELSCDSCHDDLFEMEETAVSQATIAMTIFAGEVVYRDEQQVPR